MLLSGLRAAELLARIGEGAVRYERRCVMAGHRLLLIEVGLRGCRRLLMLLHYDCVPRGSNNLDGRGGSFAHRRERVLIRVMCHLVRVMRILCLLARGGLLLLVFVED